MAGLPSGFATLRDLVTFALGILGVGYEAIAREGERPALLVLYAGLIGLPLVLPGKTGGGDEK